MSVSFTVHPATRESIVGHGVGLGYVVAAYAPHPSQSGLGYVLAVALDGRGYAVWPASVGPYDEIVTYPGKHFPVGVYSADAYAAASEYFAEVTA